MLAQRGLGLVGHVVLDIVQRLLVDPLIRLGCRIEFQPGERHGVIRMRVPRRTHPAHRGAAAWGFDFLEIVVAGQVTGVLLLLGDFRGATTEQEPGQCGAEHQFSGQVHSAVCSLD
ncbi:hypothetical protein D3C76_1401980 [compost metagenome]